MGRLATMLVTCAVLVMGCATDGTTEDADRAHERCTIAATGARLAIQIGLDRGDVTLSQYECQMLDLAQLYTCFEFFPPGQKPTAEAQSRCNPGFL